MDWPHVKDRGIVHFSGYGKGLVIKFESLYEEHNGGGGKRESIRNMSPASMKRAAFNFGFADCEWAFMSLLTWREIPPQKQVKAALRRFAERWSRRWGETLECWILEIQQRGAPHYHLFHSKESAFAKACYASGEGIRDDGARVVRGGPDFWIRDAWLHSIGAENCERSRFFNARGIVEYLRHPDAAGRYVAKECAKRAQKLLPAHYSGGLGRWWYLRKDLRPVCGFIGEMDLETWPFEQPLKFIWNGEDVAGCIGTTVAIPRDVAIAHRAHYEKVGWWWGASGAASRETKAALGEMT